MKFVLAVHGTRGDVEPCAAVGVELRRRGHAVHTAVPPNLIEFVESAGLTGVAYGPDSDEQINTVAAFVRNLTRAQNPLNLARAVKELFVEGWAEMGTTLTTLADGADLVMTGQTYHGVAANVAEYYDIPGCGTASLSDAGQRPNRDPVDTDAGDSGARDDEGLMAAVCVRQQGCRSRATT